jgi:hypothetical protein
VEIFGSSHAKDYDLGGAILFISFYYCELHGHFFSLTTRWLLVYFFFYYISHWQTPILAVTNAFCDLGIAVDPDLGEMRVFVFKFLNGL